LRISTHNLNRELITKKVGDKSLLFPFLSLSFLGIFLIFIYLPTNMITMPVRYGGSVEVKILVYGLNPDEFNLQNASHHGTLLYASSTSAIIIDPTMILRQPVYVHTCTANAQLGIIVCRH